jgi:heat-inducible transcriptional repressor
MDNEAVTTRAQQVLKLLIERYLRDGQPIGSKTLVEEGHLALSPASVRNVMAELEELGYLAAPHTSAGRIPTVQGLRFFVDTLVTMKELTKETLEQARARLNPTKQTMPELLDAASHLLSQMTGFAGLVTMPRFERRILRHLEFLPLSDNRVLMILVINESEVQNAVIQLPRFYSPSELEQTANYLNQLFVGKDLHEVRQEIVIGLRRDKANLDRMMEAALDVAEHAFSPAETETGNYLISGQVNLLDYTEPHHLPSLRQLFEAFNQKRDILHVLDQCIHAEGVQLFIGQESGYSLLDDYSLITAPYRAQGQIIGVLGVIGPTRMAYDRVIPAVDITAKLLSSALNKKEETP